MSRVAHLSDATSYRTHAGGAILVATECTEDVLIPPLAHSLTRQAFDD
jgi:hypothetical protein